jgi:hypothetical protein
MNENHGTYVPISQLRLKKTPFPQTVVWGAKVSPEFRAALFGGCHALMIEPDPVMSVIAFETGKTFSPSVKNLAGSGATGLFQFMPDTARYLGTSIEALEKMTAVQQLEYCFKHLAPYANRLITFADYYMAILLPSAIGQDNNFVLFHQDYYNRKNLLAYVQNKGLDKNFDGKITKEEAAWPVMAIYEEGKKHIK